MRVMKRMAAVALSAALLAGAGVLTATNASAATYGCQRYQSYQSVGGYSGYFASYDYYDGNTTVPVGGSFSYAALEAQCALKSLGYGITADGYYGPKTQSAVADFQSKHWLSPDGFVGPSTWPALRYYAADQRAGCGVVAAGAAPKVSVAAVPMGC
ncbi:peptidoglycan-binding protein [Kitasatospora hibisci]|uniref:peptidoglycan-binding domain-containing protein n=1 Tax=Kitasatospora hibisci TaxID=3369522 RepID=UPI0037550696